MSEYDFGKAVTGLQMSLLWAKDGIAWDEYPNAVFNQKRYHEYMEKGVFFQASDDIKENLEWVFSHDFDIWAVAVSAVRDYKNELREVVTADQVKRHLDNPLLFELPERGTESVRAYIECREALRWLYEIRKVRKKTKAAPVEQAAEPAADRQRGRKVKLSQEVFERDIFPILDKEFPSGGDNAGIIKRCAEIGKKYGVSESTIKRNFYEAQSKKRGYKLG